jgi:hypothetical protein
MEKFLEIIKKYKWAIILSIIVIIAGFYKIFNPYQEKFMPKCIFYSTTGYQCPGCGSQRAIHNLVNFDLIGAMHENLMLVISIPYLIFGAFLEIYKEKNQRLAKIHDIFYGYKAALFIFFLLIFWWIFRNFTIYHNFADNFL